MAADILGRATNYGRGSPFEVLFQSSFNRFLFSPAPYGVREGARKMETSDVKKTVQENR